MINSDQFYNCLYFIGFKMLLVDNVNWQKIDDRYSVKIQLLSNIKEEAPVMNIMVVDNLSTNIYEHNVIVSKYSNISGKSSINEMIKSASLEEKLSFIKQKDLLNRNNKPYKICFLPINMTPLTDTIYKTIEAYCAEEWFNLNEKIIENRKETINNKIKISK